jgi:biotin carboxylase
MAPPRTILCLASYEKGHEFLRQCKRSGWRVLLLTSESLKDKAHWPTESLDDIFYMPDVDKKWNVTDTIHAVSYLARTQVLSRIVPMDDFDLELAANLREHLRVPGMGDTTTRYFRDKLAMRMKARAEGVNIPEFVHALNDDAVREFVERVPGPWVLKPRMLAGAIGIRRIRDAQELEQNLSGLGDERSYYLLEKYVPGDIFHVDSIVGEGKVLFASASAYGRPPLDVSHDGDVFTSCLMERGTPLEQALLDVSGTVLRAMGLVRGVSHTELIVRRDAPGSSPATAGTGKHPGVYFLETSARVGGAHIADLVDAGRGINLWAEWAKLELAGGEEPYAPPPPRDEYAGLLVSLARHEHPDTSAFDDPEVVWRMNDKPHHIGLIVRSPRHARVTELIASYTERVRKDHLAVAPPKQRPAD